ncbi:UbiA family prenyltransferase [Macromonas nakdongensis]|uniref:UbiA family prenyltransferase n=1 Tax=Macromonas nakdongensis TaxID=1843082 RepID=UPI000C322AF4|nr:UbiA family prenyltransferase [Macromonas nakdongensis]
MSTALPPAPPVPLYVDLDGTLVRTDTLHESVLLLLRASPLYLLRMLWWLLGGKAAFKRKVAEHACPAPEQLPYTPAFLDWLRAQQAQGRPLVLATAADARIAQAVAGHLGGFADVLASNTGAERLNLSRQHKRAAIEQHARAHGHSAYAYAGNSADDLPVWDGAAEAVAVNAPAGVLARLRRRHPQAQVFAAEPTTLRQWLKAIRLSQWAKNGLLFVPVLAAHRWDAAAWWPVALAFLAFGLCASATYLINDLLDLPNDRRHAHKRHRPLAAGRIGIAAAVGLMGLMFPLAYALAWAVSPAFLAALLFYTAVTLAYSFRWKRVALLDVLLLSGLYTLRLVAGALAAGVELSNWLLAISLFLFLGLALVKRCAELEEVLLDSAVERARGRGYHQDDLPGLRAMGVASGFLTVMVLALYIDSQNGRELYAQPGWLWGAVPLLLWWIMRIWLKTGRRELHGEDPLQFALHDRFSWWVLAGLTLLGALASWGV